MGCKGKIEVSGICFYINATIAGLMLVTRACRHKTKCSVPRETHTSSQSDTEMRFMCN